MKWTQTSRHQKHSFAFCASLRTISDQGTVRLQIPRTNTFLKDSGEILPPPRKTTKNISGPPLRPWTKQPGQTRPDHALRGPGSYFVVSMHCWSPSTPSCLLQGTRTTASIKNTPTETKVLAGWSCFIYVKKDSKMCSLDISSRQHPSHSHFCRRSYIFTSSRTVNGLHSHLLFVARHTNTHTSTHSYISRLVSGPSAIWLLLSLVWSYMMDSVHAMEVSSALHWVKG